MNLNRCQKQAVRISLLLVLTLGAIAESAPAVVVGTMKIGSRHLKTVLTDGPSHTCVTVEGDRQLECSWADLTPGAVQVTIGSGSDNVIVVFARYRVLLYGGALKIKRIGQKVGSYRGTPAQPDTVPVALPPPTVTVPAFVGQIASGVGQAYFAARMRTAEQSAPQSFTSYGSNALNATSQQIGPFTFSNWSNGLSGTGQQIGNFGFYNWNDGTNATTNRVGSFTFTNFSDGTNCTTNRVGQFAFTNCN